MLLESGEVWQDEVCTVIVMECDIVMECGVAWRGVTVRWRGVTVGWCGVVWCGVMVWCGSTCHGVALVLRDVIWCGVCHLRGGVALCGVVWYGGGGVGVV
jgi:hypothetical protein